MNQWSLGVVAALGLLVGMTEVSRGQDFYVYGASPVYSTPVYVPGAVYQPQVVVAQPVVTAAYAAPYGYSYSAPVVVQQPIVQMAYSTSVVVAAPRVVAAPVYLAPTPVRETLRVYPHGYTQTVRAYGPTYGGPHYSRVRVHSGLFGTTIRARSY